MDLFLPFIFIPPLTLTFVDFVGLDWALRFVPCVVLFSNVSSRESSQLMLVMTCFTLYLICLSQVVIV